MNKIKLQYRPGTNDIGRRFHSRVIVPFVLPLLGLVLAMASPGSRAQADPIEVDYFPNSRGVVEIQSPLGTVLDTVTVNGPTTVNVDLGSLGDGDADGLEQLQTEMVQMDLTGTSSVLGPVIVRLRDSTERPFQRTLGELEERLNVQAGRLDLLGDDPPLCVEHPTPPANCEDTTAYSFFDVYFEVQVGGNVLHNEAPKKMEATITHKPPATEETYERPEAIRLYDEAGNPTNVWVAGTHHTPFPYVPPIGGLAEFPDRPGSAPEATEPSADFPSSPYVVVAAVVGLVIAFLGVGGWYARRRSLR